MDIIDVS